MQSKCEYAAHQFLCKGDCNKVIGEVKDRLGDIKEQVHREMKRIKKVEVPIKALEDEQLLSVG